MRPVGNFHPEWGYLAPAPNFMRTARIVLVAAAVGATAGAVVVLSLTERPGAETSIAARTLARPAEAVSPAGNPQPAPMQSMQTRASPAPEATAGKQQAAPPPADGGPAATESPSVTTPQSPTNVAALAEAPAKEASPAKPAAEAAALAASPPAQKKIAKKPHPVLRYAAHADQFNGSGRARLFDYGWNMPGDDYYYPSAGYAGRYGANREGRWGGFFSDQTYGYR